MQNQRYEVVEADNRPITEVVVAGVEDMGYRAYIEVIHEELQRAKDSFIKIGCYLKHIKDNEMYLEDGYSNIYEFAEDKFHISRSLTIRFMNLCLEFSVNHNSPVIDDKYKNYAYSQLVEILPLKQEQREMITSDMTVRQIREIKKGNKKDNAEKKPGNIPEGQDLTGATSHQLLGETLPLIKTDTQPQLPAFMGDNGLEEWFENVEEWGLWYEDPNIQARYYKYVFSDGSRLVAVKYRYSCPQYMKEEPWDYPEETDADGEYCEPPVYHMIYSEEYLERHKNEQEGKYKGYFAHDTVTISTLAEFLDELNGHEETKAAEEQVSAEEAGQGTGRGGKGPAISFASNYVSNEYILYEFDPDHLGDEENENKSFITRQYVKFYKEHGYIPRYFISKNACEVKDYAHTLTTGIGNKSGMGSILFFYVKEEIAMIMNDDTRDYNDALGLIRKLLRIAAPEEKKKAEEMFQEVQRYYANRTHAG